MSEVDLPAPATQRPELLRPFRSCGLACKKLGNCLTCYMFKKSKTHPWHHKLNLIGRLLIAFIVFVICYLPWEYLKFTRPKMRYGIDRPRGNSKYRHFDPEAPHHFTDLWPREMTREDRERARRDAHEEALKEARRGVPPDDRTRYVEHSERIIDLAWVMYGITKELWGMIRRQSLQLFGGASAAILIIMHIQIIAHDLRTASVSGYISAVANQANASTNQLTSDSTCAYADGTGIANWAASASGWENIVWFLAYHVQIMILCLAMLIDELTNVRVGLFAPQWSRAGNGWTLCFLSAATLSVSADWGTNNSVTQFRYFILISMFFLGLYNVFKGWIGECGRPGSKSHREGYRVNRYPFWFSRSEFQDIGNDHVMMEKRPQYTFGENGERIFRKQDLPRMNFREAPPHELVQVKERRWDYELHKWVDIETLEPIRFRRHFTENWQYAIGDSSWPLDIVSQDHYLEQGKQAVKLWEKTLGNEGGAEESTVWKGYKRDLLRHWHMEQNKLALKWWLRGCPFDMPKLKVKEQKAMGATKNKPFVGLSNWKPTKHPILFRYLDVRRLMAMIVALCMFVLQIVLAYNRLASYREQYATAQSNWNRNGGPSDSDCAYFKESTVPIFVQASSSQWKGVLSAMALLAVWHSVLCGMCVAVFFVAWSNNMYYGMHSPIPFVTLVGCRMSSNSVGVTLGFVAISTLQLGFFFGQPDAVMIARLICYAGIFMFVIYTYPNEYMRNFIVRDPLFDDRIPVSSAAMKWMSNNTFFRAAFEDYVPMDDAPEKPVHKKNKDHSRKHKRAADTRKEFGRKNEWSGKQAYEAESR